MPATYRRLQWTTVGGASERRGFVPLHVAHAMPGVDSVAVVGPGQWAAPPRDTGCPYRVVVSWFTGAPGAAVVAFQNGYYSHHANHAGEGVPAPGCARAPFDLFKRRHPAGRQHLQRL